MCERERERFCVPLHHLRQRTIVRIIPWQLGCCMRTPPLTRWKTALVTRPSLSTKSYGKIDLVEAQEPTKNPKIPKKHRVYAKFFEKFARTFAFFWCDASQEASRNYSEKLVQMNFFILGGFFRLDFLPVIWIFSRVPEGHHPRGTTLREALRGKFAAHSSSPRPPRESLRVSCGALR